MKRITAIILLAAMLTMLCSCGSKEALPQAAKLDTSEEVTLTVCGGWTDCRAIENAAQAFSETYPNCSIEYEFLQNYEDSLQTRLSSAPETVDLFLYANSQSDSPVFEYEQDLFAMDAIDLSGTNEALVKNFTLKNTDPNAAPELHAIPMGGELRGLYVNKTLLHSLGLSVPTNAQELLDACAVLLDAGYIPMNGNPSTFSQWLLYPYVCNLIANADDYQATYDKVNNCEPGVSELFRQPLELMYTMIEKGYYNYKYVETELNMFTDSADESIAKCFFGISEDGSVDAVGRVAFMGGLLSQETTMQKTKDDYHSNIDYEFILAPVSDEGGFAYVSPGQGIALNKSSAHLDWAAEFFNFLFQSEENTQFTSDLNLIPNTQNSFAVIKEMFDVPDNRVSDLGQATFDYGFYSIVADTLLTISKGNNPKYMNTDANGNTTLYPFDYYLQQLEDAFAAQRESAE